MTRNPLTAPQVAPVDGLLESNTLLPVLPLFRQVWGQVLKHAGVFGPTLDPDFPGFYEKTISVAIALVDKQYVVGMLDAKGGFIPNAGPFDSTTGAVIAAVGMAANRLAAQTARALTVD